MKIVKYFLLVIISCCAGIAGAIAFYGYYVSPQLQSLGGNSQSVMPVFTEQTNTPRPADASVDFVAAAEKSRPAVVYIKVLSTSNRQSYGWDPFWDFFGNVGPVSSSGSGVIVSDDGFIVTNSHVVDNATKIEVVMNNNRRTYPAAVVGVDPSTDLALLKIEAKALPFISFANSDKLKIGEWVVAVGNPFNLTSTVTAGIVSAKGRNINIVQNQFPIESFIQTDAAINPGNSGGALVNISGELVGINTAIMSKTGSYNGYGFAIPANIVRKVISDIKEFGYVQRAFIEAEIVDIDARVAEEHEDNINGVYVRNVFEGGNAAKAGLKNGDLILKIDDRIIDSRAVFDEQLAYHRPGDQIKMVVKRGKETKEITLTLTNKRGTTSLEKSKVYHSDFLGADFEEITRIEKEKYSATSGIRVFNLGNGQLRRMNLPDGFIVTAYNGKTYQDPQALIKEMEQSSGRIQIEGINPNGSRGVYSFYIY